ncbi:MAG TPA: hypothetical protein VF184_12340 [Phycisphaeraceae bacterium]
MPKRPDKHKDQAVQRIAREVLDLETLDERRMDDPDFHELSVWQIRRALEQAYEAGRDAGQNS